MLDCLIIGAGPAGLTAAIYLARFRRQVQLLGSGPSRAELIPVTHNFPGFPQGVSGAVLLARLREQAAVYGVRARDARVEGLRREADAFVATAGGQEVRAATVLLATGIVDQHPDFPGLREATLAGLIRWCPICDGFDVMDQAVAVMAPAKSGLRHALFLRTYTRSVTLLALPDSPGLGPAEIAQLQQAGVELVTEPVLGLGALPPGEGLIVRLAGGKELRFDTLYPMHGCSVQGQLATALGADCDEDGDLQVDARQCTSVPGLYAIGDVVNTINQISVAIGHAATAATAIHNQLPRNYRE
jgi:thioredoxin reductase (NADPH)